MSKARFDQAFARFMERGEQESAPQDFFGVLAEVDRQRARKTVELRARIVEGRLEFEPSADVSVHGNEIVLGDQRIVVTVS